MTAWANQGPSLFKATDYVPHDTWHAISLPEIRLKHAFFHYDPPYPRDYSIFGISISLMGGVTQVILGQCPK